MSRPLLLLDVDGTLVPIGRMRGVDMTEPGLAVDHIYVRWRAELPDWLAELREHFDLVWATSWEDEANEVLAPLLGLPPLPIVHFRDEPGPGEDPKLSSIARFVRDRPFAWVDDTVGRDAFAWAERREVPALMLEVRADRGIERDEVDALVAFAERLGGGTRADLSQTCQKSSVRTD